MLDAGALTALERNHRAMWVRLKDAVLSGEVPRIHGGVLGQVWRGGRRQARLSQALAGIEVLALDGDLGRAAGRLPAVAGWSDVIDAAVVLIAEDGDVIVTSDLDGLEPLSAMSHRHLELVHP